MKLNYKILPIILLFFLLTPELSFSGEVVFQEPVNGNKEIIIKGYVKDDSGPLPLVSVLVQGKKRGTTTDDNGLFEIAVKQGETLVFKYLGKEDVYFSDFSNRRITVLMTDTDESLNEVMVKVQKKEEDYIVGPYGRKHSKGSGFSSRSFRKDQFNRGALYVSELIKGRFQMMGAQTINGETGVLIVVDGVPQGQENLSTQATGPTLSIDYWLDVNLVEQINVLRSIQATARYGTLGVNGAIEIITVNNPFLYKKRLSQNYTEKFKGETIALEDITKESYVQDYENLSLEAAFNLYNERKTNNKANLNYYVDIYDVLDDKNADELARIVLKDAEENFQDDIVSLKAIAYKYQEGNRTEDALRVFNRIMFLSSGSFQAYRDLAQAYHFNGEHRKAFKIYDAMIRNEKVSENENFGLKKTIKNEYENLINKHRSLLDVKNTKEEYLERENLLDYRVTIEWNDLDAEFNLQVVDPKKHHFTWSHSKEGDPERIRREKEQGFALEESFLTKDDKGEWSFNMQYLINPPVVNQKSVYVKLIVFENYGKANEKRTIKVFRLDDPEKNINVVKLEI
ncbi:MAG: carboxypeptidase-like regulatory domain-containing protein [Flavobacteriaceae bacterium]|nr:carboxypeptidase-like regulatory domain-containing protein [Flavobacteriaceae bacterium]